MLREGNLKRKMCPLTNDPPNERFIVISGLFDVAIAETRSQDKTGEQSV